MNNLVYFRGKSSWAYDCNSFLGYWEITKFIFGIILAVSMIVIVSWSYPLVGL